MPRAYRVRATRPPLGEGARRYLLNGEHAAQGEPGSDDYFDACYLRGAELWREHRDELLAEWIARHPGSRPRGFWEHEAPADARRKLGGSGRESAVWYSSEALWGYCDCKRDDPPRIESVAAFLLRVGAMEPAEVKRVPKAALRPVQLAVDREGWAPPLDEPGDRAKGPGG